MYLPVWLEGSPWKVPKQHISSSTIQTPLVPCDAPRQPMAAPFPPLYTTPTSLHHPNSSSTNSPSRTLSQSKQAIEKEGRKMQPQRCHTHHEFMVLLLHLRIGLSFICHPETGITRIELKSPQRRLMSPFEGGEDLEHAPKGKPLTFLHG